MRTEYKIFVGVAGFLFAAAALYGFWTHGETGQVEHGQPPNGESASSGRR